MLQKISDSRTNSKDLKDFINRIEGIESIKNELKNKTEENDQLKASRNLLQDENKKLTQINYNLNMENEKYKTLQNNSEIVIQNFVAKNEQEIENLKSLLNKSNNAKAMNIMPSASNKITFF